MKIKTEKGVHFDYEWYTKSYEAHRAIKNGHNADHRRADKDTDTEYCIAVRHTRDLKLV